MTLQRFNKIRDEGIFSDFSWNTEELEDFSDINLIYGWNGTGKTTLSRLMDKLGNETEAKKINVEIKINNNDIPASKFLDHSYSIKVFNRDYIDQNILASDYQKQIIFIGEEAKIQSKIEQKNSIIANKTKEKLNLEKSKESEDNKFGNFCIDNAKSIKGILRSIGTDSQYYQNYDIKKYMDDADRIIKDRAGERTHFVETSSEKLLEKIKEPYKEELNIEIFEYSLIDLESIHKSVNEILSIKLARETIEKLDKDKDFAKWTRDGLKYYNDQNSKACPWCEEMPSVARIKKLQKYFDDSYEQLHTKISNKIIEIEIIVNKISDSQKYQSLNLYSDISQNYSNSFSKLTLMNTEIEKWLNQTVESLNKKLSRTNEFFSLKNNIPSIDISIFQNLNEHLNQHNTRSRDHYEERTRLIKEYADNKIMENLDDYIYLKTPVDKLNNQIHEIEKVIKNTNEEIDRLMENAKDVKTPLEELNASIIDFFGHNELQFADADKKNGYILVRGKEQKTIPKSLSEGEKTSIALLYFIKSLFDNNFDKSNAIIVFDDPVSSMDSTYLYKAIAAIEQIPSEVCQTFILTHNFSLFCAMNRKYRAQDEYGFSTYMLGTDLNIGKRTSTIRPLDQMLKDFDSEYHYLFKCLLKVRKESILNFELHYNLPNMARRFLEMFLAFKYPSSTHLTSKMKEVHYDETKKASILRFVHTFSHKSKVPDPNHEENVIEGARYIIKTLMEMVESLDKEHYKRMVIAVSDTDAGRSDNNDMLSADAEVVANILKKYDSDPPIKAAYFRQLDFIPSPGNWAQSELLVIAEGGGDIMQRYQPFGRLETEIMENNINCVIKIYTPEEMSGSSIPVRYQNLVK